MMLDSLTIAWADTGRTTEQSLKASDLLDSWARKIQGLKLYNHGEAGKLRTAVPTLLASVGRRKADLFLAAARSGEDPKGYKKCARQFLDVYEEHEDYDRGDELLFNAALCFEADYQVGNAIRARKALLEWHPKSKLAKKTLRELGENYHAIAFYSDAAERYEQFAESYGKDEFAGDALENAFLFRLGLGQQQEATKDLERYETMYRRKDPKRAGRDLLGQARAARGPRRAATTRRGLRSHLRAQGRHRSSGRGSHGRGPGAVAQGVLQEAARRCLRVHPSRAGRRWARARAGTRPTFAVVGKRTIPERCGQATQGVITVHRRDAKLSAVAQRHFEQALDLAARAKVPEGDDERAGALRDAVGQAMVFRADAAYEEYLRIEMPEDLDFFIEEWKKGLRASRARAPVQATAGAGREDQGALQGVLRRQGRQAR